VASTIAVIEFVQLRAANERIEELESGDGGGDGGPFGDFGDLVEDLLGETEGLFEGTGEIGSLVECLGGGFGDLGEAGTTVGEIAAQVEGIRELEFLEDVEPRFLSDQEMTERVRELFLEEYTPEIADLEQRLLSTLGAIPPGTDLRDLRSNAIGQQVAGFYEPETGELVVRQAGTELSAIDRITLAHELDHALTDQALGIPLPDDPVIGREDANLAALALVEGDATLVMQRYSATLGLGEQFELLDPEAIAEAEAGLSGFPPYLEQELIFPYEEGLNFVCDLYANGGWEAVNAAYADPPASSDQILFPDRYRAEEEPVDPPDPPKPGKSWKELAQVEVGAANLLWLFSAPGGDMSKALADSRSAVSEWAGGEVTLWTRGTETALEMVLAERHPDAKTRPDRLCGSVAEWLGSWFEGEGGAAAGTYVLDGPDQDAALTCGNGARYMSLRIGPDFAAIGLVPES
jgi:hypothetical protein